MLKFLSRPTAPDDIINAEIETLASRRIFHADRIAEFEAEIAQARAVIQHAEAKIADHSIARDAMTDVIAGIELSRALPDMRLLEAAE